MKRWAVVVGVLAVLLGLGGWWFWSLAAVPDEAASQVSLKIDRQPVSVRLPNTTLFVDATNGMALTAGATVKTGEGGQATLTFFRQAETRLDQNSEVTIGDATQDANDPTKTTVRLDLEIGRLWSRVLRLFDLDSSYSVKTSSGVATRVAHGRNVNACGRGRGERGLRVRRRSAWSVDHQQRYAGRAVVHDEYAVGHGVRARRAGRAPRRIEETGRHASGQPAGRSLAALRTAPPLVCGRCRS